MNKRIKNVIFDVGGVLLDYRWKNMIMDYGYSQEQAEISGLRILDHPLWREMDRGTYTEEEVIEKYKEMFPEDTDMIDYFFSHMELLHITRPQLYPEIEKLFDAGYNVYILSNYSTRLFKTHTKDIPFIDKCQGVVVSCDVHMMKPEREIYDYILGKYNLDPSETIFLDDMPQNVEAARKVGIKAFRVKTQDDIKDILYLL